VRKTAGHTWTDCNLNTGITKGIKCNPSFGQNTALQKKLDTIFEKKPRKRLHRIIKKNTPKGRRNQGRPLKRFLDE
jgi:hypothetical protein